ncbi:hypothetical protein [Rhizobium sp. BK376]|uniref:hypothetical protein n=1 Tax=Rhizobium sp. BK376 TaxID=2512149 RepID=UPI001048A700|nr:hypothetical protein [Rhizobium sp. BK376]
MKERFLIAQYERMMNSGCFVVEQWRSSRERFVADMWDRAPSGAKGRLIAPIDPELGYSPDNVEWQFKRRKRVAAKVKPKTPKPPKPTKAQRKAAEALAKAARRQAIAEQYRQWEAQRGKSVA